MTRTLGILGPGAGPWQERMAFILEMMREMSLQTDPEAMVRAYAARMRQLLPSDGRLSLSRRGLQSPRYRITRSSLWKGDINPWKEGDRLPVLEGGLLSELIYSDRPHIIDDFEVAVSDPAAEHLAGQRSLMAIPLFDQGVALNMVVILRREPGVFVREQFPELVWLSNLFGRATHNLVLSEDLRKAYEAVDHEMQVVADIQRALLPTELPHIPTMDLAAYYHMAHRAGGDYYDFFPLPEGRWGILIADVSGHGTPAAVLMAVTHSLAHTHPGPPLSPGEMLNYVNRHLTARYTAQSDTFVTAFYGIYDPAKRELRYACAGHNPPRLKRCQDGTLASLDGVVGLPMGIAADVAYAEFTQVLIPGDQIFFYTDGITEARSPTGELFGVARLDQVLQDCALQASGLLNTALRAVEQFTAGHPADDDRTMLVARIS